MYEQILREPEIMYNYETAHKLARKELAQADFKAQCAKAGAFFNEESSGLSCRIRFLGRDYLVTYPESGVGFLEGSDEVPIWQKIIILHYLSHAKGSEKSGEIISLHEVPDARLYYPNFIRRTSGILARRFLGDCEAFMQAAVKYGGIPFPEMGEYSVRVKALPHVDYYVVMWPGDDEFPADYNVMFDSSIVDYLPAEDITVLASMITVGICAAAKAD